MKKLLLILAITSLCVIGLLLLPELTNYTPPDVIVPGDIMDAPGDSATTPAATEPRVVPEVIVAGDIIPPVVIKEAPANPAIMTPAKTEPRVIPEVITAGAIIPPAIVKDVPAAPAAVPAKTEPRVIPEVIIAEDISPPGDTSGAATAQAKAINPDDLVQNWGPWARIAPAAGGYNPQFSQEDRDYNILPELITYTYTQPGPIPGVIVPGDIIDDPTDPGTTSPYRKNVRVRAHNRSGGN